MCEQVGRVGGVEFSCLSVSPTDVPDVGVQAHVSVAFLELEAGVGHCQLLVAIRMPGQAGDGPLHLVRIPEYTGESHGNQSRKQSNLCRRICDVILPESVDGLR